MDKRKQELYSQQQRSQTHFWSIAEVLQLLILTVGDNSRRQTRETVQTVAGLTAVDLDRPAVLLARIADLVGPPAPRPGGQLQSVISGPTRTGRNYWALPWSILCV